MVKIDNTIIQATTFEIIELLKEELQDNGLLRFESVKNNGSNVQVSCPFHKQGQERKASFGVHKETGKCNCFTCGWRGDIFSMISEINNKIDGGEYGRKWCLKHFNSTIIEHRVVNIHQPRQSALKRKIEYIQDKELNKYRYYHNYMYKRGLTDEIIEMFDVGYDKETDCITFPVNDENGNCLFIARRSVKTKYFNYPADAEKPIYALDKCKNEKKVYITESILNCLTLWKLGFKAVALNGLGSKSQIEILKNSNIRHFVLCLDPDKAGQKAQERIKKSLNNKITSQIIYSNEKEDINDLQEKFLELKEIF